MPEPKPISSPLSIWFLIGALLSAYGVLILGSGIEQLWHPPSPPVAMENLHLGIWWGAGLLIIGLIYVVMFRPSRQRRRAQERAAQARSRAQALGPTTAPSPGQAAEHRPIPGSLPPVATEERPEE